MPRGLPVSTSLALGWIVLPCRTFLHGFRESNSGPQAEPSPQSPGVKFLDCPGCSHTRFSFMSYCPQPPSQVRNRLEQAFLLCQVYIKILGNGGGEGGLVLPFPRMMFCGPLAQDTDAVNGGPGKQLSALALWADVTSSLPISLARDVLGTQSWGMGSGSARALLLHLSGSSSHGTEPSSPLI